MFIKSKQQLKLSSQISANRFNTTDKSFHDEAAQYKIEYGLLM